MSLLRSPTGSGSAKSLGGSQPNLAEMSCGDSISQVTIRNKRKFPDDTEFIKTELSELRKQITELMSVLTSVKNDQSENINKLCQDVVTIKNDVGNISATIESLVLENINLKNKVLNLSNITACSENKLKDLEADVNKLKCTSPSTSFPVMHFEEMFSELQDRNIRSKNIIIVGVPEPKAKTTEERHECDMKEILRLTKLIDNDCPRPEKIIRLGKFTPDRTRPIKVCYSSKAIAKNVLRNKNNKEIQNIKIFSDDTNYQRKYKQSLSEELNRRITNGETDLKIKYIKGIPKIINLQEKRTLLSTSTKN